MTTTSTLSITREILRVYDQRFLEVEPPVRRQVVTATKGMLGGLLTAEVRQELPEGARLRAFCIENELFEELERLIADELAGRKEGAVVVGGRVYAVYPYLRGVPRQDADITDEVGVEHVLSGLVWERSGRLRVSGRAAISRVQARNQVVQLILRDGDETVIHPVSTEGEEFEYSLELPGTGLWTVDVEVTVLGLRRTALFGTTRANGFKPPKPREGVTLDLSDGLWIGVESTPLPEPRRFWEFGRSRRG
ncbi:hypothetical protein LO762_03685 [Actinocorallia sp. API 0066]|uniref:hypothetical protein n=1 Tax=Actinocorallia sp. API 0066 TaxID=2896846 RepID=UPI001E57239B|nr:hypothetical protein [Actinocorallia sp. API 0066]MCD0448301.1 hypothetical protein [Actinocorallia sp. API 0066]